VTRVEGDFPVHFRYTVGIAAEKFLREIKDNGRLIGGRCAKCEIIYMPPRIYCERCMTTIEEYVNVENTGTVESCTSCHRDSNGEALISPTMVALVRFNHTHGGIVHYVHGDVVIGDKVRAIFKEKSQRTGSILDIAYFERI